MTKAELIRKISNRAGVPDSEAKVFFEIFLKKSSELLSPGEAIFLKGFGHFQLRKGMIRTGHPDKENSDTDSIFVELMVYYPTNLREEEVKEEIVFNVPAAQNGKYNPIDSHFSLSIGKPIIPITGVSSQDFFIPLTGQELRKLVEVRVDKLLLNIEIVKEYIKGNEVLIIDTDSIKSHQLEFNWGEVPSKNISDSKLTAKSKDAQIDATEIPEQEITWDFGEGISKEIVEDSILDVDKEEPSIIEEQFNEGIYEDRTDWNFGITNVDEAVTEHEEKTEREDKPDEPVIDLEKTAMEEMVNEWPGTDMEDEPDNDGRFERVRSFSSYFDKEDSSSLPDPSSYKNLRRVDTVSIDDYEPDTQINEDYREMHIEDSEENMQNELTNKIELNNNEDENIADGNDNLINDNEITTLSSTDKEFVEKNISQNGQIESIKVDALRDSPAKSKIITRMEAREAYYSREGVTPVFIVALIIIIAIAVALYFYLNHAFVGSKTPETKQLTQSKTIESSIVGRDYSLPVTYPYKKESAEIKPVDESIDPKALNINEKKTPVEKDKMAQGKINDKIIAGNDKKQMSGKNDVSPFSFDNLPPQVDTLKLHKNISLENGTYTIQVSSWQSKQIANKQAAKFKAKGYESFVEQAEIPGKGTWYRVKIKKFKSMRDAENFLISNQ